jgi:hypothetical protein
MFRQCDPQLTLLATSPSSFWKWLGVARDDSLRLMAEHGEAKLAKARMVRHRDRCKARCEGSSFHVDKRTLSKR